MEAVLLHESLDHQSISPYKSHLRNPKKIRHPIISRPSENFLPSHFNTTGGLLQAPPPPFLSQSYPPFSLRQSSQPPLLPLPAATPRRSTATRGLSCPPANKKTNKTRDSSLTPKKSSKSPKKGEKNSPKKSTINVSSTTTPLGPDPKELPKTVAKALPTIHNNASNCIYRYNSFSSAKAEENDQVDMFSGSAVFTISPPPSSLPLPTFSLRPKLSCKAESAAGIDSGATDDLRRLLRLR